MNKDSNREVNTSRRSSVDQLKRIWIRIEQIPVAIGSITTSAGVLVILVQFFIYLKDGEWQSYSLMFLVKALFSGTNFFNWLTNPTSWFGLHEIIIGVVSNIPLSLFLIVTGFTIMFCSDSDS